MINLQLQNRCAKKWDTVNEKKKKVSTADSLFCNHSTKSFHSPSYTPATSRSFLNTVTYQKSKVNVLCVLQYLFPQQPHSARAKSATEMEVYLKEQFVILSSCPLLIVRWCEHSFHLPPWVFFFNLSFEANKTKQPIALQRIRKAVPLSRRLSHGGKPTETGDSFRKR